MTINLEVRRFLDLEALEHGLKIFSFRVWIRAQFKRREGWTPTLPALIDTVSDLKTSSPPLRCWALLADGAVPVVLGCAGFLDRAKLILNAPRNVGWLEF